MTDKKTLLQLMNINRITLSFPQEKEVLFRKRYFSDSISQVRIAFLLVTVLYASFSYLDSLNVPEYIDLFFTIRYYLVIPILTLGIILSFTNFFHKI